VDVSEPVLVTPESPAALINRELSWLGFARRVLALAEDQEQPLLERVKFAGIMGMIYDEFAMKRIGGLFRQVRRGGHRRGPEGLTHAGVLQACRAELRAQQELVARLVEEQLRPALRDLGTPVLDVGDLDPSQRDFLARYFADAVEPILVPLAADAAHRFPFISNLGLNVAVLVAGPGRRNRRFVRVKVPANSPRWVPLPDRAGWVPLEQVIAGNLGALFPRAAEAACFFFRVTRGAKDDPWRDQAGDEDADLSPGAIIGMVTAELTARKYAGVVRLEVSAGMPEDLRGWLATQLGADPADVIALRSSARSKKRETTTRGPPGCTRTWGCSARIPGWPRTPRRSSTS
jgi:polyphosphate kinase